MSAGLPFYMREAMFQQWHRDNPLIWEYFKQFSFAALNAGHKHISHWLIINRIRWECSLPQPARISRSATI